MTPSAPNRRPFTPRQPARLALPVLLAIGWATLAVKDGEPVPTLGFAGQAPRGAAFRAALDDELERITRFLAPR